MESHISLYPDEEYNENLLKNSFRVSSKLLPFEYISCIPKGLQIKERKKSRKGYRIKGDFDGFRFYFEPYYVVSAGFNLNDFKVDYKTFLIRLETMFSTLHYLNGRAMTREEVYQILEHIRENGRYIFSLEQMCLKVRNFHYQPSLVTIKSRDYWLMELKTFKKRGEFSKALNNARKTVNSTHNLTELFFLLEERIVNNDYGYMNEALVSGYKNSNLLIYAMIRKFNLLCTGRHRQGSEQLEKQIKREALYYSSIKRLTLKTKLNPQKKIDYMLKAIVKCEPKFKTITQLVNNRTIAQQMFLIIQDLTGLDTGIELMPDEAAQNQLKLELMNLINKTSNTDCIAGAKDFNQIYIKYPKK